MISILYLIESKPPTWAQRSSPLQGRFRQTDSKEPSPAQAQLSVLDSKLSQKNRPLLYSDIRRTPGDLNPGMAKEFS